MLPSSGIRFRSILYALTLDRKVPILASAPIEGVGSGLGRDDADAAVDWNESAGHVGRRVRSQPHGCADQILRLAPTTERDPLGHGWTHVRMLDEGAVDLGANESRAQAVDADT